MQIKLKTFLCQSPHTLKITEQNKNVKLRNHRRTRSV
jgi:hypothetical protein